MRILFLRIVLKKHNLTLQLSRSVSLSIMPDTEGINLLLVLKIVTKKLGSLMSSSIGEVQRLFTAVNKKKKQTKKPKPPTLSVFYKIKLFKFNLKTD